jgi:predicted glycoside hydrolase/deacetylase ChbG (UPF0249 family)
MHRSLSVPGATPVKVIVNADDFGMNAQETDAICEGLAAGRINSATVMANGGALDQVLQNQHLFPGCSFGAHLNLTYGVPVSMGPGVKLLVDHNGRMSRAVFNRLRPTLPVCRAIYEEWRAQIELLFSKGIKIGHLDSHNHVHTTPLVFPALKAVQKRFGIRRVRISKNIYSEAQPCSALLKVQKGVYNSALRSLYATRTTSGFTDLITFCEVARGGRMRHRTVEVMIHPKSKGGEAEDALLYTDWENTLPFPIVTLPYDRL